MKTYRVVDEQRGYTSTIKALDLAAALNQYAKEFHSVGVREFDLTVRVFEDDVDRGEWFVSSEMAPQIYIRMKVKP